MDPIDYSSVFNNVQSPQDAILSGYKTGVGISDIQNQRAQAQRAQLQQQQMNADLSALSNNPTPEAIGKLSIKYPQLSEQLKRSSDVLSPVAQQAQLDHASQVYSAIQSGETDIAQDLLKDRAKALRNSGDERGAGAAEMMATLIKDHPEFAKTTIGLRLAATLGPEKFTAAFTGIGNEQRAQSEAPFDLKIKQAKSAKDGAEAKVAVETVPGEIQAVTEKNLTSAAKRRIDELNVQIGQADSETKRGQLVLERDKLVADQAAKGTERGDTAQSQIDSAQHALDTIKELRASPLLKDTTGNYVAGVGTVLGKALGAIPGTENKDFRGQLESLKSQVFLPAVQQIKGMGALSNAEGEKLTAAVASLDADMKPESLKNAMGIVDRYMTKGLQKGLAKKDVPTQGGGFVTNHPTFGAIKEGDINRLMKQYPGATREQVMQFLNQGGK